MTPFSSVEGHLPRLIDDIRDIGTGRNFLKMAIRIGYSMDNSRRDVCNRGVFRPIGLKGVTPHAHDPAAHRRRFRGPPRPRRRHHPDVPGPTAIPAVALP